MSAPDAYGWMPIGSAPKDWSDVLVYAPGLDAKQQKVCEAFYSDVNEAWLAPAFGVVKPTHWQPLPKPPVTP